MSPESMVGSLIREEYIETSSDDGWVTLTSLGYMGGGDSGGTGDSGSVDDGSSSSSGPTLEEMLIDDAGMDARTPVSVAYDQLMLDGLGAGDYVLLDRSFGGGVVYGAGGGQSGLILLVMEHVCIRCIE